MCNETVHTYSNSFPENSYIFTRANSEHAQPENYNALTLMYRNAVDPSWEGCVCFSEVKRLGSEAGESFFCAVSTDWTPVARDPLNPWD